MTAGGRSARAGRRAGTLAALLVFQALCTLFFIGDVIQEFRLFGLTWHTGFETVVAVALAAGTLLALFELRRVLESVREAEAAVAAASGAFGAAVLRAFDAWGLTRAEAEVAMLALKGFDVAEIAALRGAAAGTVRAQLARVYAKAGVTNRSAFVALFIEDLLSAPPETAPPSPPAP